MSIVEKIQNLPENTVTQDDRDCEKKSVNKILL